MNTPRISRLRFAVAAALVVALSAACVDVSVQPSANPSAPPVNTSRPATLAPSTANPATSAPGTAQPTPTGSGDATAPPTAGPPSTQDPSGSPQPGATIDPALAAEILAVMAQVPALRELPELQEVPFEFITRDAFRDQVIDLAFEDFPEERLLAEERVLKRLGLLPEDASLRQMLIDLYGGGVAAFYRPDTKRFYIISRDEPFGPGDRIIVAHEYTHALQDQHYDLEGSRIKDLAEGDAALGQLAAVEGDATLTMQKWAELNLTPEEQLQAAFDSLDDLDDPTMANMPWILRRQLEFPYFEGLTFAQTVHASGGFAAVNESLTDAPESTEQILHPEKYLADEQPVDETIDTATPPGFENAYEQTIGELLMQIWIAGDETPTPIFPGFPVEWPHTETVAGWGGDRLAMYEHEDGRWAIVWETSWDTPTDMQEFATRAGEVLLTTGSFSRAFPGGNTESNEYVILLAGDQATLNLMVPSG